MTALSTWSPFTLLAVILGYWIVAGVLLVLPMLLRVMREAWLARRDRREPLFEPFQSYPVYLLHFRRTILFFLLVPPVLFAAVWFWARMFHR